MSVLGSRAFWRGFEGRFISGEGTYFETKGLLKDVLRADHRRSYIAEKGTKEKPCHSQAQGKSLKFWLQTIATFAAREPSLAFFQRSQEELPQGSRRSARSGSRRSCGRGGAHRLSQGETGKPRVAIGSNMQNALETHRETHRETDRE